MFNSYWLAQQFLTRLPTPAVADFSPVAQARAVYCYPLVGLLMGALLWSLAWALPENLLKPALLLCLWVLLTGGLHLDGLADSADGWLGGLGDPARTLAIMKDSRSGAAAVMVVPLLLLVKFAALASLAPGQLGLALLLVPVLGRCVPAWLFFTSPAARPDGMAASLLNVARGRHQLRWVALVALALTGLAVWHLGPTSLWLPALLGLLLFWLRRLMLARIGGVTGDTVGASVEIIEMAALVLWALLLS